MLQAASYYLLHNPCARIFNPLEKAAILIACLCHDIQHPGRTNTHLINKRDPLAVLYNDQAILENHHASVTFRLTMSSSSVDIFAKLSDRDFHYIRSKIIDSILVTDISKHFEYAQVFARRTKQDDSILLDAIEQNRLSRRATLLLRTHSRASVRVDHSKQKESSNEHLFDVCIQSVTDSEELHERNISVFSLR